jgi:hypothetical protein
MPAQRKDQRYFFTEGAAGVFFWFFFVSLFFFCFWMFFGFLSPIRSLLAIMDADPGVWPGKHGAALVFLDHVVIIADY